MFFLKVYLRHMTISANEASKWSALRGDGNANNSNTANSNTADRIIAAAANSGVGGNSSSSKSNLSDNPRLTMILESLADLSSHDFLFIELYANYDCDPSSPDILLPLCTLLSKCATPEYTMSSATNEHVSIVENLQLTSVHCLLNGLRLLVTKEASVQQQQQQQQQQQENQDHDGGGDDQGHGSMTMEKTDVSNVLKLQLENKKELQRAGVLFNKKPKKGIKELERIGVLLPDKQTTQQRAYAITQFLRNTSNLEKEKVGEYIGHGDDEEMELVRTEYTNTFSLEGRSMVSSLRMFLGKFRLPGEAQQIDRILQTFARRVFESSGDSKHFATEDVAYLLSFSIIMLNTDLHSPNIKPERKMTLSQFVSRNKDYGKDVSNGKILPLDYLVSIYNSIKSSEFEVHKKTTEAATAVAEEDNLFNIDLTEVDLDKIINDDGWQDMLRRSEGAAHKYYGGAHASRTDDGCSAVEVYQSSKDVFNYIHTFVGAALSLVLTTVSDGSIMEEMLDGYLLLARGAALHGKLDILDGVMSSLAQFSGLPPPHAELASTQRAAALLQYGRHHKGHMATMALFGIYRRFFHIMGSTGWETMVSTLLSMWQINLLPRSLLTPPPMLINKQQSQQQPPHGAATGKTNANASSLNDQSKAHEHFLTVSRVTRAQAKSERGLRRTTSSGLFSWLFASGEEDEEDDPHGYSNSNGKVLQDDGTVNLAQRPDDGPVTLEELSNQVKRRYNTCQGVAASPSQSCCCCIFWTHIFLCFSSFFSPYLDHWKFITTHKTVQLGHVLKHCVFDKI